MSVRLIARLDIKGDKLIKGIHLEGLRVIGTPTEFAQRYYKQGADELIFIDCVASLYGRNNLDSLIRESAKNIFIPITVGGGIRTEGDVDRMLQSGADKVAINTAAVADPDLLTILSKKFGSQCVVLSIEAKKVGNSRWEVYTDNGREPTGLDVVEWAKLAVKLGAGEILLTSIDKEGTRKGFDLELTRSVSQAVVVPVVASGGMGCIQDLVSVVNVGHASAVAMADIIHYSRSDLNSIRAEASSLGVCLRRFDGG